jgi:hypothetical protein
MVHTYIHTYIIRTDRLVLARFRFIFEITHFLRVRVDVDVPVSFERRGVWASSKTPTRTGLHHRADG